MLIKQEGAGGGTRVRVREGAAFLLLCPSGPLAGSATTLGVPTAVCTCISRQEVPVACHFPPSMLETGFWGHLAFVNQ